MTALLKDALKPNLVQTLEGNPAFIHGGPFANIAHGCNSIMATRLALKCADYVVTEAGFGADLGAEKFLDIKCRLAGFKPSAVIIVATVRALKSHGGVPKKELEKENLNALEKGLPNLIQHIENITKVYKLPAVVAVNTFPGDTGAELELIEKKCAELGVKAAISEVWAKGGEGGVQLAREVVRLCEQPNNFEFSYDVNLSINEKIEAIAKKIYHADGVVILRDAQKHIRQIEKMGLDKVPICMAKTQYSFSDDASLSGAPRGWRLTVRDVKISAGAGFIVVFTGEIMTMPGLPPVPSAEKIDIDSSGKISGLS
jgi:formate--tetrahydrofolate ligase